MKNALSNEDDENDLGSKIRKKEITPIFEEKEKYQRITLTSNSSKVFITCYYSNGVIRGSYIQGGNSNLYMRVINKGIEMVDNKDKLVKVLNNVYGLEIDQTFLEERLKISIPHYRNETDKHYNNLLSAVFNSLVTGYMPDYTFLITPIFRAYEYYLHQILGVKMGLKTCNKNGKNNFSYFNKNEETGKHECNSKELVKLTEAQINFLNELYQTYYIVRHPCFHWPLDDVDAVMIDNISVAKRYLKDGFDLIDKYYTLF